MFRVHFDPSNSMFVVQVLRLGLFWVTCRLYERVRSFETYDAACEWTESIGLSRAYKMQAPRTALYSLGEQHAQNS